ncbi:hypothetical protein N7462_002796 [Penicillium macrosclerotiorum]|uniref:uncharacterized protein n=1 Tax=Penicillium macrosclerotiorum TaxID=303699 RepID=UPI002547981D|nr:uncharacterized protein N7462_002796 [Penicillium macrosclerotiorum]KAJ5693373.1 hypothetical protein N7462_002796 [Penicillium macrosclerotiorum]
MLSASASNLLSDPPTVRPSDPSTLDERVLSVYECVHFNPSFDEIPAHESPSQPDGTETQGLHQSQCAGS